MTEEELSEEGLSEAIDSEAACEDAVLAIGRLLKELRPKSAGRRVIMAAALVAGIYDVDNQVRFVRLAKREEK